jgi:hypothetical protein
MHCPNIITMSGNPLRTPPLAHSAHVPWHTVCTIKTGIREMTRIKTILQHNLNSLHIYCRLVHLGMARAQARHLAAKIERLYLYSKVLYR